MDGQKVTKNQGIQVIRRAADILRLLARDSNGLSLGQISKSVKLPRSTVQRIVGALADEGFVAVDGSYGGIKLGSEIQAIAQAVSNETKDSLKPLMTEISDRTGETVDLAVLTDQRMLFVDQVVGTHRLRTVSSIGETFPLTTTANGKAALACMDPDKVVEIALSEGAISKPDLPDYMQEISNVRGGKLARDENEHTEGICALGFAVKDKRGEIFAISVPVPSSRYLRTRAELIRIINSCRASFKC